MPRYGDPSIPIPDAIHITGRRGLLLEMKVGDKEIIITRQPGGAYVFYINGVAQGASKTWNAAMALMAEYLKE
jgi:hypothetical protein